MMHWVHQHPYLAGTLAVAVVILFVIFRRSSASATATVSNGGGTTGPDDTIQAQMISAGVALQTAQLQGSLGIAQLNATTNQTALLSSADVQKTQLAAQVQLQQILSGQTVSLATNASGQEVSDATIAAQLQLGLAQVGQVAPVSGPVSPVIPPVFIPTSGPVPSGGTVVSQSQSTGTVPGSGTAFPTFDPSAPPLQQCGNIPTVGGEWGCVQSNEANPNWGINPNAGVTSPVVMGEYSSDPNVRAAANALANAGDSGGSAADLSAVIAKMFPSGSTLPTATTGSNPPAFDLNAYINTNFNHLPLVPIQ